MPIAIRKQVFYHAPRSDPATISFDNSMLRTTMPRPIRSDCLKARDDLNWSGTAAVDCPVRIQLGDHDPIMPSSLAYLERETWPATADVTIGSLAEIGQCFNRHRNREAGWENIHGFLISERTVGSTR